jgi:methylaspartate mutase epsilon subunit
MTLRNKRLSEDEFSEIRKEVLAQWPTGGDVDFSETVEYHKKIPAYKSFSGKLKEAMAEGKTLVQPRAGVPLTNEQILLLRYLEKEGHADLLPVTVDSYTRHNRYDEAEIGIKESQNRGKSMLNGYPIVNHGVFECRKITEAVGLPVQVRHGTPDARLLAEISVSGGFTSFEGGGISYNIPYSKNNSLEKTIYGWQYVDRLVGMYEEAGVSVNREPFGPLTGTLVPPCISHSVAIIESLLAAEQGVKNITVGYGQCGNVVQDVAAIRSLELLTGEYLGKYGYGDVTVTTVLHQWMGGFPPDESEAFGLISSGAVTASLAGATKVIVKTPHEAMGIPTKEANAQGLKATKMVVKILSGQRMPDNPELGEEIGIICAETRSILDKVFELGNGDVARGVVKAFETGALDIPFAPSRFNAGVVLPARDSRGAVRILEFGNLPFGKDIKDFHKGKLEERARFEKRKADFRMVIDDIYALQGLR